MNKVLRSATAAAMLASLAACAPGATQSDRVATACEAVASAAEGVTAAAKAGRVSQSQLDDARRLYHTTDAFCEPVKEDISALDFAQLVSVGLELAKRGK